ncbi:carbamoyl phosphate synthase small subunit [Sulfidibacter corallicola]|uniref:Carbamoyl phosphate synthase small chain n=1 Tax=Sulfidibacter corallicola TaxID=2818388 RepID=A0A8A4TV01_SULCO|nr:glutamine-hydrolyzing carbamoyl-phosphate synthase small subunit [Sulfidibacter corallicola]QTD53779.1 glutamine-hydrolyzing carbamoyl-phosphate synthase small subunit [Sulfidibacter corallicola]
MQGYLLFPTGQSLSGTLIGAKAPQLGELVFNTSMTGYQEILTDPSYHRQIVVLTYPEIGNYGCHLEVNESTLGHAAGMVFRNLSPGSFHNRYHQTFDPFLAEIGVTAITGLDTRRLTQTIRDEGPRNVLIAPQSLPLEEAKVRLAAAEPMEGANLVPQVSTTEKVVHGEGDHHIVLLDLGIKLATIRALQKRGCRVTQVPWNTDLAAVEALKPDGILISNGPGDPAAVPGVRGTIAALMDRYPVMGICLGFQLMALSLGGRTYKLPFGHRGGNHPVKFEGRVVITSQNHGFAVHEDSLDLKRVEITHHSLFDGSLEGFRLRDKPVFGVQFHPEAAPGPNDCLDHFDYFLQQVANHKGDRHA